MPKIDRDIIVDSVLLIDGSILYITTKNGIQTFRRNGIELKEDVAKKLLAVTCTLIDLRDLENCDKR